MEIPHGLVAAADIYPIESKTRLIGRGFLLSAFAVDSAVCRASIPRSASAASSASEAGLGHGAYVVRFFHGNCGKHGHVGLAESPGVDLLVSRTWNRTGLPCPHPARFRVFQAGRVHTDLAETGLRRVNPALSTLANSSFTPRGAFAPFFFYSGPNGLIRRQIVCSLCYLTGNTSPQVKVTFPPEMS